MIESIFNIIGLDYTALGISYDTLVLCGIAVMILSIDWIFRIIYLVVSTLTQKRR